MNTPILISCPAGPSNLGADVGHGGVEPATEGSARQTSPVAAWAHGSTKFGLEMTMPRRRRNNGIRVFLVDSQMPPFLGVARSTHAINFREKGHPIAKKNPRDADGAP